MEVAEIFQVNLSENVKNRQNPPYVSDGLWRNAAEPNKIEKSIILEILPV